MAIDGTDDMISDIAQKWVIHRAIRRSRETGMAFSVPLIHRSSRSPDSSGDCLLYALLPGPLICTVRTDCRKAIRLESSQIAQK